MLYILASLHPKYWDYYLVRGEDNEIWIIKLNEDKQVIDSKSLNLFRAFESIKTDNPLQTVFQYLNDYLKSYRDHIYNMYN